MTKVINSFYSSILNFSDKTKSYDIILHFPDTEICKIVLKKFKLLDHHPNLSISLDRNVTNIERDLQSKSKTLHIYINNISNNIKPLICTSPTIDDKTGTYFVAHQRHLINSQFEKSEYGEVSKSLSLGQIRNRINIVEPITRLSSHLQLNLSSIRSSEVPGQQKSYPTGLFTEEACQIMRYSGESQTTNSINIICDENPKSMEIRAMITATLIWYAIEGRSNMDIEHPNIDKSKFETYIVEVDISDISLFFYKNTLNNKWWVGLGETNETIVPCAYSDYSNCLNGEISNYLTNLLF